MGQRLATRSEKIRKTWAHVTWHQFLVQLFRLAFDGLENYGIVKPFRVAGPASNTPTSSA
jgi:hypothetical protein